MEFQYHQVNRIPTGVVAEHSFLVFIKDSTTDFNGKTGLVFNSAGLVCRRIINYSAPNTVGLTELANPNSLYVENGFGEKSSTLAPGWYRFDPSGDYFDDFQGSMIFEFSGAAGMATTRVVIHVLPELAAFLNEQAGGYIAAGSLGKLFNDLEDSVAGGWRPNCTLVYDHTIQRIRLLGYLERGGQLYQNALSATFALYEEGNVNPLATVTNNIPGTAFWADMDSIALNPDNAYFIRFSIVDEFAEAHLGAVGVATLD